MAKTYPVVVLQQHIARSVARTVAPIQRLRTVNDVLGSLTSIDREQVDADSRYVGYRMKHVFHSAALDSGTQLTNDDYVELREHVSPDILDNYTTLSAHALEDGALLLYVDEAPSTSKDGTVLTVQENAVKALALITPNRIAIEILNP